MIERKNKMINIVGTMIMLTGLILFIVSMFSLEQTTLGYTSYSIEHSVIFVVLGYILISLK